MFFMSHVWLKHTTLEVHMHKMSKPIDYISFIYIHDIKRNCTVTVSCGNGPLLMNRAMCVAVGLPTHTGSFKQKQQHRNRLVKLEERCSFPPVYLGETKTLKRQRDIILYNEILTSPCVIPWFHPGVTHHLKVLFTKA